MEKQIIISIGREFGSAGHEIAEIIARDMGLALYDRKLLDDVAKQHGIDPEMVEKYDERPRNFILSRRVKGHSNSMAEAVVELESNFMKEKASAGESFVVVGRCSDIALAEFDALTTIFICGEKKHKIARVMQKYELSKREAIQKMKRHDKKRKSYHDMHSKCPWGHSKGYDFCINSSVLGVEETAKLIEYYVQQIQKNQ